MLEHLPDVGVYLVSIHTYTCQVFNVIRSVSQPKLWLNKLRSHVNMVVCPEKYIYTYIYIYIFIINIL